MTSSRSSLIATLTTVFFPAYFPSKKILHERTYVYLGPANHIKRSYGGGGEQIQLLDGPKRIIPTN